MIPNDKYTSKGQIFILCFITCFLHMKSTIKLKLFDLAILGNLWCHNPSLIESPSVDCIICKLFQSLQFLIHIPPNTCTFFAKFKLKVRHNILQFSRFQLLSIEIMQKLTFLINKLVYFSKIFQMKYRGSSISRVSNSTNF